MSKRKRRPRRGPGVDRAWTGVDRGGPGEATQKTIDWDAPARNLAALDELLRSLGFDESERAVVKAIAEHGRTRLVGADRCSELQIAKGKMKAVIGLAANTFVRAAKRAERLGVVGIFTLTTPHIYVANWDAIAKRKPPAPEDPLIAAGLFRSAPPVHARSAPVHPGPPAHGSLESKKSNLPDPANLDPDLAPMSAVDHQRPWQVLTDDELRGLASPLIKRLFQEACKKGWGGLKPEHESLKKFLALCHHCATSDGIHSPVAVLKQRMKDCDFTNLRDQSHDWARDKMRRQADRTRNSSTPIGSNDTAPVPFKTP